MRDDLFFEFMFECLTIELELVGKNVFIKRERVHLKVGKEELDFTFSCLD